MKLVADPEYKAWLVDMDGTLYKGRWVKLAMAMELALFGWSALPTLRQFRHDHETLREEQNAGRALTHDTPFRSQLVRTAQNMNQPVERIERIVQDWMFERPGKWIKRFPRTTLLSELRTFKAQGGRTALVSDYPAERKVDALGARDLFDVIVANGENHGPRRLKPDPEGYLNAAKLLGISPEQCLVVGDRDDADGEAARAGGMGFRLV